MPVETMRIDNPLPQRYLTDAPGIGGVIKTRPQDFLVEELPRYEPSGEGEHLYLRIEKSSVSHAELMSCLRRHFGVPASAIGFAGMKDKHAVTRQTVSIHLPGREPPPGPIEHERIGVLWATRHTNKIKIGHLAGNRFSIRIREVDPLKVTAVRRQIVELERIGIPNYFDRQRFGYRCNNHRIGLALLREDWTSLLSELLGTAGPPFPEYQRERRELFDQGRYKDAAAQWTPSDRNELTIINALCSGRSPDDAGRTVGKAALSFWISALQSAVFNRVLDRRLDDQELAVLHEGDLAWKHDNGSVFAVTAGDKAHPDFQRRVASLEISPSGPLWGKGMTRAAGKVDEAELEALAAMGVTMEHLHAWKDRTKGARRPLRVPLRDTVTEAGVDEEGGYIRLAFDLPRGSYATVLLRELTKTDDGPVTTRAPRGSQGNPTDTP